MLVMMEIDSEDWQMLKEKAEYGAIRDDSVSAEKEFWRRLKRVFELARGDI